jgi:hypothetical protein
VSCRWCLRRWCYVNASNCRRPYSQADRLAEPDDAVGTLVHSYETCGNLNAYSDEKHYAALRGQHLRVSYPGDSGSGYTLKTLPDGSKTGSVVEFVRSIAEEVGFTWEVVPVGADSRELYSSSFTACVHSVAVGATDLCIGNFWLTSQRMLIQPSFTSALYDDEIVLIVAAVKKNDFWSSVAGPFSNTLTPSAWLLVLVNMALMSIAMAIIDRDDVGDGANKIIARFDDLQEQLATGETKQEKMDRIAEEKTEESTSTAGLIKEIPRSIYYGLLGLTAGSPAHEGRSAAGSLVILGFGIFCLLFLSSYTGATAAILIAQTDQGAELKSVADVAKVSGGQICLMSAFAPRFALRYPLMAARLVASETAGTVLQDFDDKKCIAAVLFQDGWENALTGAYPTTQNDGKSADKNHCDKVAVGGSLMSTANAMPVRQDLNEALSYLIARKVTNNEYATFRKKAREKFIGADMCPKVGKSALAGASIDAFALAGPLFISLVLTATGLVVHGCMVSADAAKETKKKLTQMDEEKEVADKLILDLEKSKAAALSIENYELAGRLNEALKNARHAQSEYGQPLVKKLKRAAGLVRSHSNVSAVVETFSFENSLCDVHVRNLAEFTEHSARKKEEYREILKSAFQQYGTVQDVPEVQVRTLHDKKKTWALVTFSTAEEAQAAVAAAPAIQQDRGWTVAAVNHERAKRSTGRMAAVRKSKASHTLEALQTEARLCELWRDLDEDQSNTLDMPELRRLLVSMGMPAGTAEAEAVFEEIDADHSGEIQFDEFLKWWREEDIGAKTGGEGGGGGGGGGGGSGGSVATVATTLRRSLGSNGSSESIATLRRSLNSRDSATSDKPSGQVAPMDVAPTSEAETESDGEAPMSEAIPLTSSVTLEV